MNLSDKLDKIASGHTYFEHALYDALDHPATTNNDKQMLMRYLYGSELSNDRFRLLELAIYIREYENGQEKE